MAKSRRTSQTLRESEERYRALADLCPEMVAVQSEGRYVYINSAGASLLGASAPEEVIGKPVGVFIHAEHREKVGQWLQRVQEEGKQATPLPSKGLRLDGQVMDVEVTGAPITHDGKPAIQIVLRDVTERRRLEANLHRRQKLELVGELAAGVAHEVNNPLSVISGFSEILLSRELGEGVRKNVQTIFEEAQRASRVIQDILSFARQDKPEERTIDVTQVLDRVRALKAYDFRVNHIETELRLKPDMPMVMADEGKLLQVFFNIMTNAQQAMVDSHGRGNLLISGERVGDNLRLGFADDGPGIAQDNLPRIFDPFFTTKGVKGTGLGLSVSRGIVAEHGGRIWAESEPGRGATFFVELPGIPG